MWQRVTDVCVCARARILHVHMIVNIPSSLIRQMKSALYGI